VGKSERKRPLGKCGGRCEDIKVDLKETYLEVVNRFHLDQDRDKWWALVNTVTNLLVLQNLENFLTSQ
jgi:hypothetical protein